MENNQADLSILLFDGVCNLCSGFVQFIIKRDPTGQFHFASLQSDIGQKLLQKHQLDTTTLDTVVLIENGKAYTHADVALRMMPRLKGFWSWIKLGYLFPRPIRNGFYNWVARNRYRWFGEKEACWLPTPELKARFL